MVFLPKIRQQIMLSAAHAFRMHKFMGMQPAWAAAATRPVTARDVLAPRTARRLKVHHLRLLFGLACLLLLIAILLTQPAAAGSAPYLTYDKIAAPPAEQAAPVQAAPVGSTPCSMLTSALNLCAP